MTSDLDSVLPELDVVYMLRVQQERLEGAPFPTIREYHKLFGLTKDREKLMKPDAIICHPGPINRGVEFDSYMADHPATLRHPGAGLRRYLRAYGYPVSAAWRCR